MPFPPIDPVAFSLGFITVHWYGLAYLLSFVLGAWICIHRGSKLTPPWNKDQVSDLTYYMVVGVIVGGRMGYVLFYNLSYFASNPLKVFYLWEGGMSFHGGLLGSIVAMMLYARAHKREVWDVFDLVAFIAPIGLFMGRMANFVNQELWGKATDLPWGIIFTPPSAGGIARHPTQLYEALLEGVVLFVILWLFNRKPRALGLSSAVFLMGYAIARIGVEFFRLPDAHLGYLAFGWVTMGQVLSLAMLLAGAWLAYHCRAKAFQKDPINASHKAAAKR